jgi:hypothetical protein
MRLKGDRVSRRRKRHIIRVKIPPLARYEFDKFLEKINKAIYNETAIIRLTGDTLQVYIYGGSLGAEKSLKEIRKIVKEYSTGGRKSSPKISIKSLSREAGVALPGDVLIEIIKAQGYHAEISGENLETNAPLDTVYGIASLLGDAIKSAKNLYATRTAKKFVFALLTLYPGSSLQKLLDVAEDLRLVSYNSDGKLYVIGDWREAIKVFRRSHRQEGDE